MKKLFSALLLCISSYSNSQTVVGNNTTINKSKIAIRENYNQIGKIKKWSEIKKIDLMESTEGGEAKFYYSNKILKKIIVEQYGESGKVRSEYYLKNGKLSFVFEQTTNYNRPIYYDAKAKIANNDTEQFEPKKSEIIEERNYFENDVLMEQISNKDCESPFTKEYLLEEQKRILDNFKVLMTYEIQQKHIK